MFRRTRPRWLRLLGCLGWLCLLSGCVPTAAPPPPTIVRPLRSQAPIPTDARYLGTLGGPGAGPLQFHDPSGLAFDPQGFLYVADAGNHRVQRLSPDGRFIAEYGTQGWRPGEFQMPRDVYVRDRILYVADTGNDRIQACTLNEWRFRVIAGPEKPLDLAAPQGVCADTRGNFYIADTQHHRWVRIDARGQVNLVRGRFGSGPEAFQFPTAIRLDAAGACYVLDSQNRRIQKFDFSGNLVASWGTDRLAQPTALAVDRWGYVYVADAGSRRVHLFTPQGKLLWSISQPSLRVPSGVAINPEGVLFVSDAEAGNLKRFQIRFQAISSDTPRL